MNPMKPTVIVVLVIVLTLGCSFLFTRVLDPYSGEESVDTVLLRIQVDDLSREIDSLLAANRDLTETVVALRERVAGNPRSTAREPVESMAAAVDRWFRANRPDLLPANDVMSPADAADRSADGSQLAQAAQMLAMLDDPELDEDDWNEVWKKINKAGLMDEALSLLEDYVAQDPTNPDAHVALAGGYMARIMNTENDIEKGKWAIAADGTLDRALELDPFHWDARFTKATSLTFYPPIMGKQGEAMKHFEILLEQQKALPPNPNHSQTYLYLGNLHQQMGNYDKANQIWKDGLAAFPDNSELSKQLENALKKD